MQNMEYMFLRNVTRDDYVPMSSFQNEASSDMNRFMCLLYNFKTDSKWKYISSCSPQRCEKHIRMILYEESLVFIVKQASNLYSRKVV